MNKVNHKCRTCNGTGKVELSGKYAETYHLLKMITSKAGITSTELASRVSGCTAVAMCNRLDALEKLGLAKSERFGKKRLFKAI